MKINYFLRNCTFFMKSTIIMSNQKSVYWDHLTGCRLKNHLLRKLLLLAVEFSVKKYNRIGLCKAELEALTWKCAVKLEHWTKYVWHNIQNAMRWLQDWTHSIYIVLMILTCIQWHMYVIIPNWGQLSQLFF